MNTPEPAEEYDGPATLRADDGRTAAISVVLRGAFQPIDGRFHWYGRVATGSDLAGFTSGESVSVQTDSGSAKGRLSDIDMWGRMRITGVGRPPF